MTDQQTFPPVHEYGEQISPTVLAKWTRLDSDRLIVVDLARFLLRTGSFLIVLLATAAVAFGTAGLASGLLLAAFGMVLFLAATVAGRIVRRRTGLGPNDIDTVLAHRTEVDFDDWNQRAAQSSTLPAEAEPARRARAAAAAIVNTPLWRNEETGHSLTFDPLEEAREICVQAYKLHEIRQELGPRPGPESDRACDEWDAVDAEMRKNLSSIERRTAALEDYSTELETAERAAAIRRAETRLSAFADATVAVLAADDARHEFATDRLSRLREELRAADRDIGDAGGERLRQSIEKPLPASNI